MPAEATQPIQTFRDLLVWQRGRDLLVESYRLARKLPATEQYGLISQIQRSAVSIPANIAEGHARRHTGDFLHHLSMAVGSLAELETHFEAAVRLRFLSQADLASARQLAEEVRKMLFGLIAKLRARKRQP